MPHMLIYFCRLIFIKGHNTSYPFHIFACYYSVFRKSPTDIESDDSTLLHYESLRSQVLNRQENFSKRSLGLTLFIRRGMLAWIEICHRCIPANSNSQKQIETPVFAYGVTPEMIKVMANITLLNIEEALS